MSLVLYLVPFVRRKLPLLPTHLAHCTALSQQLAPTICGSTDGRLRERRERLRRGWRGPIVSLVLYLVPFVRRKLPLLPTHLAHCTALSQQLAPKICGSTDGWLRERRERLRRGWRGPIVSLVLYLVPFVRRKLPLLPTHLAHCTALSQQLAPKICGSTDGRLRERRERLRRGWRGPIVSLALFLVLFECKKLSLLPTHLAHFTVLNQQLAPTICGSTGGRLRERRERPRRGFTTT